jgi:hypothetical protein
MASSERERRRHPRFEQNEHVRLTLLGEDGRTTEALIVDASATGMRVEVACRFSPGDLVKLESHDTLLLGEVLHVQQTNGKTYLGIELTRALYGLAELGRLNRSLVGTEEKSRIPTLV